MDARAQQTEMAESLKRSIALALLDTDDGWADAPVRLALSRANRLHRDLFSTSLSPSLRTEMGAEVRKIIEAADRKSTDPRQAERLAGLVAGYVSGAVLEDGVPASEEWVKEWVTEKDDQVRASHAAAAGQVVPTSGKFIVGGAEMSGPHDPSAPIDERAGCRCHVEYRPAAQTGPDALVAAVGAIVDAGALEVSRRLLEDAVAAGVAVQTGVREDGAVLYTLRDGAVVAAAQNKAEDFDETSFVIVGLPAADDPIQAVCGTVDPAHVTLLYLSSDFLEQADQIIRGEAEHWQPVPVGTRERGELGDGGADVVHIEPGALDDLRTVLLGYEPIRQGHDAVEQFPEWTPHVTVGYPETPAREGQIAPTIVIDRLAILYDGLRGTYALGEPMSEQTTTEDEFATGEPGWEEVPLYGVLAPEGVPTGDKRTFDNEALTWTDPPLSLRWQERDEPGHGGSVVTGRMDRIWREDGLIKFEGAASMNPAANDMVALVAERALRGISVDLDDTEIEFRGEDGAAVDIFELEPGGPEPVMAVTKGRIRSAAVCPIPAYPEAFIAIGTWADHEQPPAETAAEPEPITEAFVASAAATILAFADLAPGQTEDGPGWLTHPVDTDRLRDYWVRGEGAPKIGWGSPGDFNRCRTLLAPYVKAQYLAGYCANRHKDALGIWPGEHRGGVLAASAITAAAMHPDDIAPFYTMLREEPPVALTASGVNLLKPPKAWFDNPNFGEASAIVVTEDGQVYGHAAQWGTCHVGYTGECVEVPTSPSNYAMYRLGTKLVEDGSFVPVGVITIDTGHAPLNLSPFAAAAHYDNTGKVVAQVSCGEDEHGIWVAGCVAPTATPEMIDALRSSKLSGDWRVFGSERDMIRVLAVNTPGFPVPRTAMALAASADGERQVTALVAAGIVKTAAERTREMVADAVAKTPAENDMALAMKEIGDAVFARRRSQIAGLAARTKG